MITPWSRAAATSGCATAASPASVGCANTSATVRRRPAVRARATTCSALIESPPSAKNSSSRPTASTPSTPVQMPASVVSTPGRGANVACARSRRRPLRCASARRSTFPPAVSGSASTTVNAAGTSAAGSCARNAVRTPSSVGAGVSHTRNAASSVPLVPVRGTTAASRTPAQVRSAASTSSGSTRWPRTFTWRSSRPPYSSTPSARQRARSPVRYSRAPGTPLTGSGMNRSAVSAGRPA